MSTLVLIGIKIFYFLGQTKTPSNFKLTLLVTSTTNISIKDVDK